jgi:hypothetical protein
MFVPGEGLPTIGAIHHSERGTDCSIGMVIIEETLRTDRKPSDSRESGICRPGIKKRRKDD